MKLESALLKQFASLTNDSKNATEDIRSYGTIKVTDDGTYVQLVGSDTLTPISETVGVKDGDNVIVYIKNHTATLLNNISHPASAYTAKSYLDLLEQGLKIGDIEDTDNKYYALICPGVTTENKTWLEGYYIMQETENSSGPDDDVVLSYFGRNIVKVGATDNVSLITLGKFLNIFADNGVSSITSLNDNLTLNSKSGIGPEIQVISEEGISLFSDKPSSNPQSLHLMKSGGSLLLNVSSDCYSNRAYRPKIANLGSTFSDPEQAYIVFDDDILKEYRYETSYTFPASTVSRIIITASDVPDGYTICNVSYIRTDSTKIECVSFYHGITNEKPYVAARFNNLTASAVTATVYIRFYMQKASTIEVLDSSKLSGEWTNYSYTQPSDTISDKIESIIAQSGTSDTEVVSARTNSNTGNSYSTLAKRLDKDYASLNEQYETCNAAILQEQQRAKDAEENNSKAISDTTELIDELNGQLTNYKTYISDLETHISDLESEIENLKSIVNGVVYVDDEKMYVRKEE